ncbi:MAG: GrpB family protein [Betaproteobacteria bacterium]
MSKSPILTYQVMPPAYVEYDPTVVAVAQRVVDAIHAKASWVHAEHIGSTAIPNCAGKGIVDLAAFYPADTLAQTRDALDAMGFQRQRAGHIFPESRPMRVGAIEHDGQILRLHVHVVARDSSEAADLRRFRDVLRGNDALREAYQAKKRAILQSGLSEPVGYTREKGEFITAVLGQAA